MNRMFLKIFLVLSFNVAAQNFQLKIIDPILCIDYERNQLQDKKEDITSNP